MYLIIDNFDSFTYNVSQVLASLSDRQVRVVRNDAISLGQIEEMDPEGIIISPGPGRPAEAGISIEVIRRFAGKIPILGVCLGHQAIGEAFGGKIVQAQRIVHGKTDAVSHDGKGLFRNIPSPSSFARYHSLAIEAESLPECLEVSARASDGEIMGVRHRQYLVEGVQFHPESIASEQGKAVLRNFINYRREPFAFKSDLQGLMAGRDLGREELAGFMEELTEGNLSDPQIAAFLVALEIKGPSAEEIAGAAEVLRRKRVVIKAKRPVLDTCGTGGDGQGSFNISSMAAIVASAGGAAVAKHGNRAVSSLSGSADFYSELGLNISLSPESAQVMLDRLGFAFMFAPIYHGAMKYAAPARKALGIKTLMNLLGPLANPAAADFQVLGVFDDALCQPMARAAKLLGVKRVLAVHSQDGLDELSPCTPSRVVEILDDGRERIYTVDPADFGITGHVASELRGGSAAHNADIARGLLDGSDSHPAIRAAVLLNAGAGLYAAGQAGSLAEGYTQAKAALENGMVARKMEEIVKLSSELR